MKKLIFILLLPIWMAAQTSTGQEAEFDYGIKNNSSQTITTPTYLTTQGTDGTQGKIPSSYIEKTANKQNSLSVDGTGIKYVTVDAVNTGLAAKQNTLTNPITGTGTNNYLPKFTGASALGNSKVSDIGLTLNYNAGDYNTNTFSGYSITGDAVERIRIGFKSNGYESGLVSSQIIAETSTLRFISRDISNGAIAFHTGAGVTQKAVISSIGSLILQDGGTFVDDGVNRLQVSGSIKATSHITTGGLSSQKVNGDGSLTVGYKVYTALLTQSGTSAPTAIVLENTLGGTVVWGRSVTGVYYATLTGVFTINKTALFVTNRLSNDLLRAYSDAEDSNTIYLESSNGDGNLLNNTIEIRVYN